MSERPIFGEPKPSDIDMIAEAVTARFEAIPPEAAASFGDRSWSWIVNLPVGPRSSQVEFDWNPGSQMLMVRWRVDGMYVGRQIFSAPKVR